MEEWATPVTRINTDTIVANVPSSLNGGVTLGPVTVNAYFVVDIPKFNPAIQPIEANLWESGKIVATKPPYRVELDETAITEYAIDVSFETLIEDKSSVMVELVFKNHTVGTRKLWSQIHTEAGIATPDLNGCDIINVELPGDITVTATPIDSGLIGGGTISINEPIQYHEITFFNGNQDIMRIDASTGEIEWFIEPSEAAVQAWKIMKDAFPQAFQLPTKEVEPEAADILTAYERAMRVVEK
jgi:hypothetical protein